MTVAVSIANAELLVDLGSSETVLLHAGIYGRAILGPATLKHGGQITCYRSALQRRRELAFSSSFLEKHGRCARLLRRAIANSRGKWREFPPTTLESRPSRVPRICAVCSDEAPETTGRGLKQLTKPALVQYFLEKDLGRCGVLG